MRVKDIMTQDPITINKNANLKEALKLLALHEIGRLLVIDDNRLVGIVTDGDLMVEVDYNANIEQFMSENLITCFEEDSIEKVAKIMANYEIGGLPVFNSKNKLVGIITVEDIVYRYVARK